MRCQPRVLLNRPAGKPKISVILIDWGVRESFHSLHYLNQQTADRDDYELIWLEFYDREPDDLRQMVGAGNGGRPVLDKWIVLGYPDELLFHKHRLYNVGILAAQGAVCVICDSDAIFPPTFIESLIRAFEESPNAVIHVDQVRNNDPRFHPFQYPTIEEILGPGVINWRHETNTTVGLDNPCDRIHQANYGACMAARRQDLLVIGGADEHIDYLGYVCGPYELTFRLVNYGRKERWLHEEYLYHVWHPNQSGYNTDYKGPHDGLGVSLRALDVLARDRVKPHVPNPWFALACPGAVPRLEEIMRLVAERAEPAWRNEAVPVGAPDNVYWLHKDHHGFNIFVHAGVWYALGQREGIFDPLRARQGQYRDLLQARTRAVLLARVEASATATEASAQHSCVLCRTRRFLAAQPLHCLPGKLWKKACRLFSSPPARPLWEPAHRVKQRTRRPGSVST